MQDVVEHSGGIIGNDDNLVLYTLQELGYDPDSSTDAKYLDAVNKTKQAYQAAAYLSSLNGTHYQGLLDKVATFYLNRRKEYPKYMVAAYKLVIT